MEFIAEFQILLISLYIWNHFDFFVDFYQTSGFKNFFMELYGKKSQSMLKGNIIGP